ncbi:hypothetical protein PUN28_009814 [Cardiocondyla obscurior]|uniref:MADF domain-containing protein n=1 Tax=Cardiocondyla obscurior TaxID=286306 RepID=A0AAW2FP02_9HYME
MAEEYYTETCDNLEYVNKEHDNEEHNNLEYENKENEYFENNLTYQKELVAIVKANPILLWDKRHKRYKNVNYKEYAWAFVSAMLKYISDLDAAKELYKIRQRYGKERQKVIMSIKGKSGQGAQSIYVSRWELYEICDIFLRDVIVPRKYVDFLNYN